MIDHIARGRILNRCCSSVTIRRIAPSVSGCCSEVLVVLLVRTDNPRIINQWLILLRHIVDIGCTLIAQGHASGGCASAHLSPVLIRHHHLLLITFHLLFSKCCQL